MSGFLEDPALGGHHIHALEHRQIGGGHELVARGPRVEHLVDVVEAHLVHLVQLVIGADHVVVHAEQGRQAPEPQGGGGAVAHVGEFFALAGARAAPQLFHGQRVGEHLGGVIAAGQRVDDRNVGRIGDLAHVVLVVLRADDDGIVHGREHPHRVEHGLLDAEVRV